MFSYKNARRLSKLYPRLSKKIHRSLLTRDLDPLTEENVLEHIGPSRGPGKLFNFYGLKGLDLAFEHYGLYKHLRKRGFEHFQLQLTHEKGGQLLRVTAQKNNQRHLLVETLLGENRLALSEGKELRLIKIEWLLIQNPTASFTQERPALPGQAHPGLRLAHAIILLLMQAGKRLSFDGIIHTPEHYHVAEKACSFFHFLDPQKEAHFLCLKKYLANYSLTEASMILEKGLLLDGEGKKIHTLTFSSV